MNRTSSEWKSGDIAKETSNVQNVLFCVVQLVKFTEKSRWGKKISFLLEVKALNNYSGICRLTGLPGQPSELP